MKKSLKTLNPSEIACSENDLYTKSCITVYKANIKVPLHFCFVYDRGNNTLFFDRSKLLRHILLGCPSLGQRQNQSRQCRRRVRPLALGIYNHTFRLLAISLMCGRSQYANCRICSYKHCNDHVVYY